MPDGFGGPIYASDPNFVGHLQRYLGETVTIFTTSGGESGSGFTGVLSLVTCDYVRLVTAIGFPPECSLGNSCSGLGGREYGYGSGCGRGYGYGRGIGGPRRELYGLGSVVDIPISRIASFAHNTL